MRSLKKTISHYYKQKPSGLIMLYVSYGYKNSFGKYEQLVLSTGQKTDKSIFDKAKGVRNSAPLLKKTAITKQLNFVMSKLTEISLSEYLPYISPTRIKQVYLYDESSTTEGRAAKLSLCRYIDLFVERERKKVIKKSAKGTYSHYEQLSEWIRKYGDIPCRNLNQEWVNSFLDYLAVMGNDGKGYMINTLIRFFNKLRKINNLLGNPKIVSGLSEEHVAKVWFNLEELEQIEKFKFESKRLDSIRCNFIFQANTGMRYSDFINENAQIIKDGKYQYIEIMRTQKTKAHVVIPLFAPAERMLNSGKLRDDISLDKYNQYLQELMAVIYPIDKVDPKSKVNKIKLEYKIKGEPITVWVSRALRCSTHAGRRSWATNMYNLNICTKKTLMDILGMKREETFNTYIQMDQLNNAKRMFEALERASKLIPAAARLIKKTVKKNRSR
jgi:hypothetical protein